MRFNVERMPVILAIIKEEVILRKNNTSKTTEKKDIHLKMYAARKSIFDV